MAPPGRPPKPNEAKRRAGNPGRRPLPAVGNLAPVPAADVTPTDLDLDETLKGVHDAGRAWLGTSDVAALVMLRESVEERAQLREFVMQTGIMDARKALRDLDKQIISQLSSLGFDPSARARLGVAEVKVQSKLEQIRASRSDG